MFDAGIATQTFCLAAHEKGIIELSWGIFDEAKVGELINIEEGRKVAALVAVGLSRRDTGSTLRKTVEDLVAFLCNCAFS